MGVRGRAGVTAAHLVEGDDPETVSTVRPELQLQVLQVGWDFRGLLPLPLVLLGVLLLTEFHSEL